MQLLSPTWIPLICILINSLGNEATTVVAPVIATAQAVFATTQAAPATTQAAPATTEAGSI